MIHKKSFKNDKKENKGFVASSVANREINSRGGSAVYEHLKGYDNLKKISNYKKHPDYIDANMNQHGGFAAEELHARRTNVENILKGSNDRIERSDNVGLSNHPQHDFVKVDKNGNVLKNKNGDILGAGQSKFNKNPEKTAYELSKRNDYKGEKIVPNDQYEEVKKISQKKYKEYMEQSKKLKKLGKFEEAAKKKEIAENYKHTAENVKPAKVSKKESLDAVESPGKITIKDIGATSLKVGCKAGLTGGAIGGSMSALSNIYQVVNDEKELKEAVVDVAVDTGKSAVKSGATTVVTSGVKGVAEKVAKEKAGSILGKTVGKLAKGNTATYVVTGVIEAGSTISKYLNDEIDGGEAAKELTEKGGGFAGAVGGAELGAALGTAVCPGIGTVVGGIVGSIAGSVTGSSIVKGFFSLFDD